MNLRLKRGEHGAVVGQTGTGKSFLARHLLSGDRRLVVIDPKGTFGLDLRVVRDPRRALKIRDESFRYYPDPKYADNLAAYNEVYRHAFQKLAPCTIYTDEISSITTATRFPRYFRLAYLQGRELGVSMLSSTQRPCCVPRFALTEATKFYAFRVITTDDQKRLAEVIPGYSNDQPDYHAFWFYDCRAMRDARLLRLMVK